MKTLLLVAMMSVGGIAGAMERPVLRGAETPRATDLLRAQRLAEQAGRRLKMPAATGSGWKHGGTGWDRVAPAGRPPGAGSVTIRLSPGRRRAQP
jgi:hypothetical protein